MTYTGPAGVHLTLDEAKEVIPVLIRNVSASIAPITRKLEHYVEVNDDTNQSLHGANASK